jgi:serine/threonine protein kinase
MTDTMPMSKLDRYHIQENLGEGGMGSVYKAWDTQLQRPVAIKFFHDFDPEDQEQRRRIQQEAVNHGNVQHPNVVTLFDHGIDQNRPFAVMELVDGETLYAMVRRERLTIDMFRDVAAQCLEGLNAAHKIGMLHRDLKALNVMLTAKLGQAGYRVKILDFGLSKKLQKPEIQTTDHEEGLLGSIHSMAPEQFDRKPIDQRTDLYALGCIFYFALVGKFPFDGESPSDIMVAHLRHFVRPLHLRRPDVPRPLSDWVMKFIEHEPANRHRSAWAALEELRSLEKTTPEMQSRRDLMRQALPHLIALPLITLVAVIAIAWPLWKTFVVKGDAPAANPDAVTRPQPGSVSPSPEGSATAAPQVTPLPPEEPDRPFDPAETKKIAAITDREVIVRGVIGQFLPSDPNNPTRELKFQGDDGTFTTLTLPADTADTITDDDLSGLVGMEVEVRGYSEGNPDTGVKLPITSLSQVDVMGQGEAAEEGM